jgi:hypothetical protein
MVGEFGISMMVMIQEVAILVSPLKHAAWNCDPPRLDQGLT